jgi:hypothetical protein
MLFIACGPTDRSGWDGDLFDARSRLVEWLQRKQIPLLQLGKSTRNTGPGCALKNQGIPEDQ